MTRIKLILLAGASIAIVAGCNRNVSLSGSWTSTPQHIDNLATENPVGKQVSNSIVSTFGFYPDSSDTNHGNVTITSNISVVDALDANPEIVMPYQITVSATSQISGTYNVKGHDVLLYFDKNTLVVNIDPDALEYASDIISGEQAPQIDSLRPSLANSYKNMLTPVLQKYYSQYSSLKNVSVNNDILKFKANKNNIVLQKL